MYEITAVLERKVQSGKPHFLVRWEHPEEDDLETWESATRKYPLERLERMYNEHLQKQNRPANAAATNAGNGDSQKPNNPNQPNKPTPPPVYNLSDWQSACVEIIPKLKTGRYAHQEIFESYCDPVDPNIVPDYYDIVKPLKARWLNQVQTSLTSGKYIRVDEYEADMAQLFANYKL